MARLTILLFLFSGLATIQAPQPGDKHEQSNNAAAHKYDKGNKRDDSSPSAVEKNAVDSRPSEQKGQTQTGNPADPPHDWIEKLNGFSTFIIAIFTILLFVAVRVQVKTSRDTERAWITVVPGIWSPEFYPKIEVRIGERTVEKKPAIHLFPAIIENIGKTPGRVIKTDGRYVLINSLSELSDEPIYESASRTNGGDLLFTKEQQWMHVRLTDGSDEGMLTEQQVTDIRNGSLVLYAYGFVIYKDAYGRRHRTNFGYVYHVPKGLSISIEKPAFKRSGPPEYNKAT